ILRETLSVDVRLIARPAHLGQPARIGLSSIRGDGSCSRLKHASDTQASIPKTYVPVLDRLSLLDGHRFSRLFDLCHLVLFGHDADSIALLDPLGRNEPSIRTLRQD